MAILDWVNANPQETELLAQNPQALQVLGSIANSIPPAQEPAPVAEPVMEQPAPVMVAPVAQQEPVMQEEAPVQEEGFLTGLAKGFMNAMSNPDVINTLGAFGASMGNDRQGYESNMNAYVNRLESRRKEEADRQFAQVQNSQRERMAEVNALYDSYTPESVAQFQATGDYSVLVPNKKYELAEGRLGVAQNNSQTSATRAANTQSNADRTYNRNVTNDQLKALDKQAQALEGKSATLPDGTVITAPGIYTGSDGIRYRAELNSKGLNVKPVSAKENADYKDAVNAINDPSTVIMNQDLKTLQAGIDSGAANAVTGQVVGRSDTLQDWNTSLFGSQEERDVYKAADRIDANMGNQGIGAAREMGASGINTEAEAKRFFASMPRLDRTSPEALQSSLTKINTYIIQYNANKRSAVPGSSNTQATPTGSDVVRRRNKKGEVWEGTIQDGKFVPTTKIN